MCWYQNLLTVSKIHRNRFNPWPRPNEMPKKPICRCKRRPLMSSGPGCQCAGGKQRYTDSLNSRVITPCLVEENPLSVQWRCWGLEPVPHGLVGCVCVCFWMVQINIINPISDLKICFQDSGSTKKCCIFST